MLRVNEIFCSIQSEGPFAGTPATFVRLAGCNLKCDFCDTKHDSHTEWDEKELVSDIERRKQPLLVITGGEPFLQDFSYLLEAIENVQIETNGSIPALFDYSLLSTATIVCSPKNSVFNIAVPFDCIKKLVDINTTAESLKDINIIALPEEVYLQPITVGEFTSEKSFANQLHAIELCEQTGYRLSLQWHEYFNIK